jgi:hypothetical protein
MSEYMIDVYVRLVILHQKTIDQVPETLRAAVLAKLNAQGFDGYGNPLPSAPTETPSVTEEPVTPTQEV